MFKANMAGTFVNHNVFFSTNFHKFFNSHISKTTRNSGLGWIIDSGASQHMTCSSENLLHTIDNSGLNMSVGHPSGTLAKVVIIWNLRLTKDIVLFDVLVISEYCVSLVSVHKLSKYSKLFVGFDESFCHIQDLGLKKNVWTGTQSGGLYIFYECQGNNIRSKASMVSCSSRSIWHCRLGHLADHVLKIISNKLHVNTETVDHVCKVCHRAKQTGDPFPISDHKSSVLGDLIHLDLWGPYRVTSKEEFKYFLTIVDDCTRAVWCIRDKV